MESCSWVRIAVVGTVLAACGASSTERGGSTLQRAAAYEHGAGVQRDYAAAAEIYRVACDQGRGEVSACGALIRAQLRARGVAFDRAATATLAGQICLERRDPFSCVAADLLSGGERDIAEPLHGVIMDVVSHLEPCNIAHLSECHAMQIATGLDVSGSSGAERRHHDFAMQICRLDIVDACIEIVKRRPRGEGSQVAEAEHRLQVLCDAGDADACFEAQARKEIPLRALCAAHDYGACACTDDAAAVEDAKRHGASRCDRERQSRAQRDEFRRSSRTQLTVFRDQICACTDQACVERVTQAMTKWSQEVARFTFDDESDAPSEDEAKVQAANTEAVTKCLTRLMPPAP